MMGLSRIKIRKLKSISSYILGWFFACILFGGIRYTGSQSPLENHLLFFSLLQFALLTGISQGIYEVYILDDHHHLYRKTAENFLIRTCFFFALISINIIIVFLIWRQALTGFMFDTDLCRDLKLLLSSLDLWIFLFYGILIGFLVTFIRSTHKRLGNVAFSNFFLGKTLEPQEKEMFFLFLDLKSATSLAEAIGHFNYSSFLRDYFRLVSNICIENHGDIYQFAGDGVILSWSLDSCRRQPRPLIFFQDLKVCFEATHKRFMHQYKHAPEFKAALHVGRIVATEVGNYGSALAYHGDALNTTARLQSLCNLLKKDFLCTESALTKMPNVDNFVVKPQGAFQLRGKNRDLEVYSIHQAE